MLNSTCSNHPELTGVTQDGADLDIDFDLDVELAGDYRIEFFEIRLASAASASERGRSFSVP